MARHGHAGAFKVCSSEPESPSPSPSRKGFGWIASLSVRRIQPGKVEIQLEFGVGQLEPPGTDAKARSKLCSKTVGFRRSDFKENSSTTSTQSKQQS